ncbi:MAG: peptidoglycan DD-metalloendopeptidase family protein [Gammaproteobacteria bacterium]|nr:peptidoglycan DD-metalloendopeptidase family protein [Gammaproteobacteria bacterium]
MLNIFFSFDRSRHSGIASSLVIIFVACLANKSLAAPLPTHSAVPGGVAVIPVGLCEDGQPKITFYDRPVAVVCDRGVWVTTVGIPLSAKAGDHNLSLELMDGAQVTVAFTVTDKQYETQHLTIKNKRHVNPNANDMDRIVADKKRIGRAFRHWDDVRKPDFDFIAPVDGPRSSSFGLRRILNGQPRSPHSGMDIAAPNGTPIIAPAAGEITEVGDYFFNGRSVFVDHGHNVVTMYCHLSEIDVEVGDQVEQGELIGKVGSTGRVTGAHLHFTVSLNNTRVDPALFLSQIEAEPQSDNY